MALNIKTVLISESVDPSCAQILSENGVNVTTKVGLSKDELIKEIQNYDGLVVRSATKVTADVIAAGKELKIIGRAGVGVDNIDCDAATKHGVLVINAPGGNTLSAAELTCAMIISLSRNIAEACASLKSGKWDRKKFMANELMNKTLAIIGLGRIGREVAHRLQSFGMKTIGFDPLVPGEESIKFGVESMELEKIWPLADYITVHTPLIPQTKNLINSDVLSKCPKGVKIINCARGGIVNEDDLFAALESGQCGGAGLDVFMEEPPKNTKLIQHPKVICTPHLGASTHEAQSRVADEISLQFVDLAAGKPAHGIVNSPAFSLSMAESNRPWVVLSKSAGAIAGALFSTSNEKLSLSITVHGSDLNRKQSLFSAAVLIGLLKQKHQISANFINAPTLANEHNYEVSNVQLLPTTAEGISLSLAVQSTNETHTITVSMRGDQPILCAMDTCCFNSHPIIADNMIICQGAHPSNVMSEFFGSLENSLSNIALSTFQGNKVWYALHTSKKCDKLPNNLSQFVNIWAQLNL